MNNDKKTIGPMDLRCDNKWWLSSDAWLSSDELQKRFNVPNTATKLWVTFTRRRPKHRDAIRVRFDSWGYAKFDGDRRFDTYIGWQIREIAENFGSDFYATIYYE